MPFTVPGKYVPQFQHQDWMDNVDVVQAGGENGFNIRFHNLQDEFSRIKTVMDNLDAVASELQDAVGTLQGQFAGTLRLANLTVTGSVGVGVQAPTAPLHVADHMVVGPFPSRTVSAVGRLEVSGPNAELGFIRRTLGSFAQNPAAGDRYVWYNQDGTARLWTEARGDLLYVDATGRVGIGTTSPGMQLDVAGRMRVRAQAANTAGIWFSGYGVADQAFVGMQSPKSVGFWGNTGTPNWRLTVNTDNGDLNITGNAFKPGGGAWTATSDLRLKKNIEPMKAPLDRLLRLRGVAFEWREPEKQGNLTGVQMGLVAQEVEEVFPEWVSSNDDGYKVVTIRGFEALAIEALRELKTENHGLKERCGALEAMLGLPAHKPDDGRPAPQPVSMNGHSRTSVTPQIGVDRPRPAGEIVETYDYTDAGGALLYQIVRFDPKDFRSRRPDGAGGWVWTFDGVRPVLYRLPEVVDAGTVVVTEGEKDVHTICRLGLPDGWAATCNPFGAGQWRSEYSEVLRGKSVIVCPDTDEAGRLHLAEICRDLVYKAADIRVVAVPGGVKDISEWAKAGQTAEQFRSLLEQAEQFVPEETPR